MKRLITFIALSVSLAAIAQERVLLDAEYVTVNGPEAILVRTAATPDVVKVTFQVPMSSSICLQEATRFVPRTCTRIENIYGIQPVCRDIPVVQSNPNAPRGPNYRPPMQRVCTNQTVVIGTRQIPYDCSFNETYCAQYGTNTFSEPDEVRIKFKRLADLSGNQFEEYGVKARQRSYDGENVVYDISILSAVAYEVKDRGFFGADSYVIRPR